MDAAEEQMKAKQYAEPFKADKRKVIALAIELDDMGERDWLIGRKYNFTTRVYTPPFHRGI